MRFVEEMMKYKKERDEEAALLEQDLTAFMNKSKKKSKTTRNSLIESQY